MWRNLLWILLVLGVKVVSAQSENDKKSSTLGRAVINTQVFTVFHYEGKQVYVYSALSNEKDNVNSPRKWFFYYVPLVMAALGKDVNDSSSTIWTVRNEVRLKILLGSSLINEMARRAIMKKFDASINMNAEYWDVAPLMIDSLTAYIVEESTNNVESVLPFHIQHPHVLTIEARFPCSSPEKAEEVMENLLYGIYEVKVAFFFAGFNQVSTNSISITATQLKNVFSKIAANGENTTALYIRRSQVSHFVGKCIIHVKIMSYTEDKGATPQFQKKDLLEKFFPLLQQGLDNSLQTTLDAKHWDQVWSSADLNPDELTREMNHMFSYNKEETERQNFSDVFFNYQTSMSSSSKFGGIFEDIVFNCGTSSERCKSKSEQLATTQRKIVNLTEVRDFLNAKQIQVEWSGEKLIPKSFTVMRLADLEDLLRISLVANQMKADEQNGAIIQTMTGLQNPSSGNEDTNSQLSWMRQLVNELSVYVRTSINDTNSEIKKRLAQLVDADYHIKVNVVRLTTNFETTKNNTKSQLDRVEKSVAQVSDDTAKLKSGYIGCYTDAPQRDLGLKRIDGTMSLANCREHCKGYDYFGLQFSKECFCGNTFGRHGKADETDCNMRCSGNLNEICGGFWRNSVYKSPVSLGYIGCYSDKKTRDLNDEFFEKPGRMTVQRCKRLCAGYDYFGVQFSKECFCGNNFGKYGVAPNADCNYPCDGDKNQICGGFWRISVYRNR